jgi:hypothetical protein
MDAEALDADDQPLIISVDSKIDANDDLLAFTISTLKVFYVGCFTKLERKMGWMLVFYYHRPLKMGANSATMHHCISVHFSGTLMGLKKKKKKNPTISVQTDVNVDGCTINGC